MLSTTRLLATIAAALSSVSALQDATRVSCPTLHSGTTTLQVPGLGLTTTVYSAVAALDADVNCHGYSNLFLQTTGPTPTATVSATGTLETRITICAPTSIPPRCPSVPCPPSHSGTTTVVLSGPGLTSTKYPSTLVEDIVTDCHGYTQITSSFAGPTPTKTVKRKGTLTSRAYACSQTTSVHGC